jgi:membrane protein DedA with SNARE-associated domain
VPIDFDQIADWAVQLMETLGAPGAGIAIALENLFPPIPSEVILPLAGFAASRGTFPIWQAILFTTLGSLVGAMVLYGIGAALGRDRMRRIAIKLPLIKVEDVDRTEAWFQKHGAKTVFFGRMIPIFRSLISIPAGIERMPIPLFLALSGAGSLLWNSLFVTLGYVLGENWHLVDQYAGIFSKIVLVAVVAVIAIFIIRRLRERQRTKNSTPTTP